MYEFQTDKLLLFDVILIVFEQIKKNMYTFNYINMYMLIQNIYLLNWFDFYITFLFLLFKYK